MNCSVCLEEKVVDHAYLPCGHVSDPESRRTTPRSMSPLDRSMDPVVRSGLHPTPYVFEVVCVSVCAVFVARVRRSCCPLRGMRYDAGRPELLDLPPPEYTRGPIQRSVSLCSPSLFP